MLALLIDSLYGIGSLWRRATLAFIDFKTELFVNKCERFYLEPTDSAIFEKFMFLLKNITRMRVGVAV